MKFQCMMNFRVNSVKVVENHKKRAILRLDKSATVLLICYEAQETQKTSFPYPKEMGEYKSDPRQILTLG